MSLFSFLFAHSDTAQPAASVQPSSGGQLVTSSDELRQVMLVEGQSHVGAVVNDTTAMRVGAVFACIRIRSGVVANLPLQIKRRVDERTRENATDHALWRIFTRRPNKWQTPSQFKRMMQVHLLLRGNAYSLIVRGVGGRVLGLVPLHPDRVSVEQCDDWTLEYTYQTKTGRQVKLEQKEVLHLVGLSIDGVRGLSVIGYARETIGLSLEMERHGAVTFRNGARPSGVLKHPGQVGPEGKEFLKESLDDYRSGGSQEAKVLILEEGVSFEQMSLSAEDVQWMESRKFTRSDIAMFFGVPPHMIGDTEKSTSWGSGLEQQTQGFLTFSVEDDLTTWEEGINLSLLDETSDPHLYARFKRQALVRGDIKTRREYYQSMLQWGVLSPNEVRRMEDENPRIDGDIYYPPPNMTASLDEGSPDKDKSS